MRIKGIAAGQDQTDRKRLEGRAGQGSTKQARTSRDNTYYYMRGHDMARIAYTRTQDRANKAGKDRVRDRPQDRPGMTMHHRA